MTESEKGQRRATSSDVARLAGVSRATVSYVLNNTNNKSISDATRQLVLAAAAELGHFPHASARTLRSGRSDIVLVLVPGYTVGLLFEGLLDRLDDALSAKGYGLLVHRHSESKLSLTELWGLVSPAIVIVLGGLSAEELDILGKSPARLIRIDNIVSDAKVGRMQAEYLFDTGHTRIGFGTPSDRALTVFAAGRLEGVAAACAERGMAPPEVHTMALDPAEGARAIEHWTRSGVTAVAAYNDDLGLVLLSALRIRGDGEPPLAILGVDDLPMAALGLTTIRIDSASVGDQLVEAVFAALEDRPLPAPTPAPLELIVRDSA